MTHIEAMKQGLEALEEAVHYTSAPVWSPSMTKECNEAITSLRQAIAEAEKQEPVAWKETHGKVIKALAGIVNVHTPDNLFDLDAIPREPVMGLVQQIKVAIDAYQPQRTKQEPVIDKSAAIRIATALGWTPPKQPAPAQEPCDMGNICAGCSPRNADGSCLHEKENLACDCYEKGFNDGMKEMDGMGPYTFPPSPQRKPIQNLQCFHCQDTIETLNDKVMQLMAKRTWVGLTDEEISEIAINNPPMVHEFARAIEAAHGIKESK